MNDKKIRPIYFGRNYWKTPDGNKFVNYSDADKHIDGVCKEESK
jgi:hypothetical protein